MQRGKQSQFIFRRAASQTPPEVPRPPKREKLGGRACNWVTYMGPGEQARTKGQMHLCRWTLTEVDFGFCQIPQSGAQIPTLGVQARWEPELKAASVKTSSLNTLERKQSSGYRLGKFTAAL